MAWVTNEIKMKRCPDCGHDCLLRKRLTHAWKEGVDCSRSFEAQIDAVACAECGAEFIDEFARQQKHAAWCEANGLLSPRQIHAIRKGLKLSIPEFAKLLGAGPASVGRWERGAIVQNVANDRLLRLLRSRRNVERLAELSGIKVPALERPTGVRMERDDATIGTWRFKPSPHYRPTSADLMRGKRFRLEGAAA